MEKNFYVQDLDNTAFMTTLFKQSAFNSIYFNIRKHRHKWKKKIAHHFS